MILVERHILHKKEYYDVCRKSGLLYNDVLYHIKQSNENKIQKFTEYELTGLMVEFNDEKFRLLPSAVSQQVVKQVFKDVKSFYALLKDWKKTPSKYNGRPKFPKYKSGEKQNILTFTKGNCFKIKDGEIYFIKNIIPNIKTNIEYEKIKQVRLIPQATCYVVEVVYEKEIIDLGLNKSNYISIDLGLNNFVTTVTYMDNVGFINPFIINGKSLKSFNRWYNKKQAKLKSFIGDKGTSNRLNLLVKYRNNYSQDKMHKISRHIINYCIENNIGSIIIGKNEGWKNEINLGSCINQKFVEIPHSKFIQQLEYKANLVGIKLIKTEESYTSKCDFLAKEPLKFHKEYKGKRVKRGLFQSSFGKLINADINGALNILRKVIRDVEILPCSGLAYNPIRINLY